MNNDKIERWLNQKDDTIYRPSFQLINKLKKIPYNEVRMNSRPLNSWILWVAAASFVGFMLINFSYLKNDSKKNNSLDAYFPITTAY
ncbi:MAG: hypothetical protein ACKO7D_06955 [Bacteroidota bacterium]